MLNQLLQAAFQFNQDSKYLQFTFKTPFATKKDNSEDLRVHVTAKGEVTYRPYPMSFSRSVVGLTVVVDNTKQGQGIVNLINRAALTYTAENKRIAKRVYTFVLQSMGVSLENKVETFRS